jgi:hypothetical protein
MSVRSAGEQPAATPGPGGGRGSALAAVGVVLLVAVVAAGGVLGLARALGLSTDAPDRGLLDEEVPSAMAGGAAPGAVPDAIAAVYDLPVVAVADLGQAPLGAEQHCPTEEVDWEQGPEQEVAWATPDGIVSVQTGWATERFGHFEEMGMARAPRAVPPAVPTPVEVVEAIAEVTPEPTLDESHAPPPGPATPTPFEPGVDPGVAQPWRVTCVAQVREGGAIIGMSGSSGPAQWESGGLGWSCCDRQGLSTAAVSVDVPAGAVWAVQERGSYWLAHPVASLERVVLVWRFREGPFGGAPRTHVEFLDADGVLVDDRYVGT